MHHLRMFIDSVVPATQGKTHQGTDITKTDSPLRTERKEIRLLPPHSMKTGENFRYHLMYLPQSLFSQKRLLCYYCRILFIVSQGTFSPSVTILPDFFIFFLFAPIVISSKLPILFLTKGFSIFSPLHKFSFLCFKK